MCVYVHVVCVCVPNIRNKMGEFLAERQAGFSLLLSFPVIIQSD